MDSHFDKEAEDTKLARVHEREEEDVARILSDKYGMTYADLSLTEIDNDALRTIPEALAREADAVAFAKTAKVLSLAVHNPNNSALAKLLEELASRDFTVKEFLVSKKSLDRALSHYADLSFAAESKPGVFVIPPETLAKLAEQTATRSALKSELDTAVISHSLDRVSLIMEILFAGAFALRASDIHFEPAEKKTLLRLRIDGLLSDTYYFDPKTYHQLEVRASFIPGNYGESIVLRILDPETTMVPYTELGIPPKLLARLAKQI